jgi:murein DD-endopeptidase MepM/ murein hydrolase activator NlpD
MYATKYSKIKVKEGDIIEKGEIIGITESNKRNSVNFSFLLMKDNKRINPLLIFE